MYPWMKVWPNIVNILRFYELRSHCHSVTWSFSKRNKMKYNTDGACRGNPDLGALAYCFRDENGDLVYAMAKVWENQPT